VVQVIAAVIVVQGGACRVDAITIPGGVLELGWAAAPLTVVWIVLVTNAVNLIDGIDGLAAGTAVIALVAITVVARRFGLPAVSGLAAILAGACLGFLVFNFHPARIYLGDSGSLLLGFALGVLSTQARAKGATGAITFATVLMVALPIGDTLFAIERRYLRGLCPGDPRSHVAGLRRIFQPDRAHLHHRMLRLGLGHRGAACALWALQAIACAWAIYLLVGR
jgi:UDP-GlcNAc:undecaprenyl-phosphate GlcNAc-1-phosphate transferase